jgi:aspartyl-tRNA(Asn)/glutamyl-tRNA(Gln) amidotransferase subunit A
MSDLADLSIDELLTLFRTGEASAVEALNACLARIVRLDDRVNAVITLLVERATAQAEESTNRWRSGTARPLEGIPYGLKDIIATAGIRTTGGSPMYETYVPDQSATLVDRLEAAGAVLVGKLQTFEFASGSNATTSNPWDLSRWPAGSSSGPAAAVAAHEMPLAIGTDTGGSIAIPAAFCGIVGLKATYGRVSRAGVFPLSWTLDHVGPMTRSAIDAAHALGAMAGYDPRDPTAGNVPVPNYAAGLTTELTGVRVGVPTEWFFDVCAPEVEEATRAAIDVMAANGATINEFELPSTRTVQLHAIELTIVYAELASLHEPNFHRLEQYGEEFQRLLTRAQFTSAVDYLKALRARHLVQLDFQTVFEQNDVVVVPGGVCVAPRHDHLVAEIGDEERPLIDVVSRPTAVMDIVGLPAVTIPAGFDDNGLPLGIQIAARPYNELSCLSVAHAYQQLTNYHTALPPIVAEDVAAHPTDALSDLPATLAKPVVTATRDRIW